jgi:hypothetical protein
MPAKQISTSPNITVLDFHAEFDIPSQELNVDLSPSVWIGTGYDNVLGAKYTITKLSGNMTLTLPNPTSNTYDVTPPDMQTGIVTFPLPLAFQGVEWGIFQLQVILYDADGTPYTLIKTFDLCRPKQIGIQVNTDNASMVLALDTSVRNGLGTARDNTVYYYKQAPAVNKEYSNAVFFDSQLQIPPIEWEEQPPLSFQLYTGKTTFTSSDIVTYNLDDEFAVIIKYTGSISKELPLVDYCKLYCCYTAILDRAVQYSGTNAGVLESKKAEQVALNLWAVWLGTDCGYDVSRFIDAVQTIGNCNCSCDCAGAITAFPTSIGAGQSINIFGVDGITVSSSTSGNTTTFIVSGSQFQYVVRYDGVLNPPELVITPSTSGDTTTFGIHTDLSVLQDYFEVGDIGGVILYNDISDSSPSTGTSEQILKTYTIPQATGSGLPVKTWSSDGDEMELFVPIVVNTSGLAKTLKLKVNGTTLAQYITTDNANEPVFFHVKVNRVSAGSQFYTYEIYTGVSTTTIYKGYGNTGVLVTDAGNTFTVTVTNATSSADSVTCKQLQVKLGKKG